MHLRVTNLHKTLKNRQKMIMTVYAICLYTTKTESKGK